MKKFIKHLITGTAIAVLVLTVQSCSDKICPAYPHFKQFGK